MNTLRSTFSPPAGNGLLRQLPANTPAALLLGLAAALAAAGATTATPVPVDESQLPPASTNRVDFARDIQPLLEGSCLKCHGPERPKSGFRIDSRAAILKGGENGPAVLPGQSARSPLIQAVARLVDDMAMPPQGKGAPLTPEQVGLLRAWVDQGVPWGDVQVEPALVATNSPFIGWMTVRGDERKFRELNWMPDGWNGGTRGFEIRDRLSDKANSQLTLRGHALRDDYRLTLDLRRGASVYVRAGVEQSRKWFDDSGGYLPSLGQAPVRLGRDLHLDMGRAWIEAGGFTLFGLQLSGGYEYRFKEGEKSLLQWQPVFNGGDAKSILPNAKSIDEHLHVLRLDAAYDFHRTRLTDSFRYEFYDLDTRRSIVTAGLPLVLNQQTMGEGNKSQTLVNAFQTECTPREWLLLSAGYLFSHTDSEDSLRQRSVDGTGAPAAGVLWNGRGITLEQSAHLFNANAQWTMWEGMTLASGLQSEWNRHRSIALVHLDETDPFDVSLFTGNTNRVRGDYDRFTAEEKVALRNTQIPFTVVYGEARFRQETIDQIEELSPSGAGASTLADFIRSTQALYDWQQYRAGFTVSPWTRVSLNAYAQRLEHDDSFDHVRDERPIGGQGNGYPAFIAARQTTADELGARLVVRPASWIKSTLGLKLSSSDFETWTDKVPADGSSVRVLAGQQAAETYSLSAVITPWRRVYWFSSFSFQHSRTDTRANGLTSVVPYRGHVYSAIHSASYALDANTDLRVGYDFSYANYGQDNDPAGLPLGIDYRRHGVRAGVGRKFLKRFLANLEYVWQYYDEPSNGHFNDFTAHGLFATLNIRWD